MKTLLLVLIGILVGAFCAIAATNALAKRHAHPRAVMIVMARHLDALRSMDGTTACSTGERVRRLSQLVAAAEEMDFAFERWQAQDPAFRRHAARFREVASTAATTPCERIGDAISSLSQSCESCHRQFR